jgi:hypothetical protein
LAAIENSTQLIELFYEELITNDTQLLPMQNFRDDVREHFVDQLLRHFESDFNLKTKDEMLKKLYTKLQNRHLEFVNNEEAKLEMMPARPDKLSDLLLNEYVEGVRAINLNFKTKLSELRVPDKDLNEFLIRNEDVVFQYCCLKLREEMKEKFHLDVLNHEVIPRVKKANDGRCTSIKLRRFYKNEKIKQEVKDKIDELKFLGLPKAITKRDSENQP